VVQSNEPVDDSLDQSRVACGKQDSAAVLARAPGKGEQRE